MDFRFRAIDDKQPEPAAPSSSRYSSDHPLRDDLPNAGVMRNCDDAQHELVKQRIKEEIMIREIASRRMLEAEIRRDLLIEQELAMHRAARRTEGFAFDEQLAMRLLDRRLNHIVDQSSRGLLAIPGSSSLNSLPLRFPEPQMEEPKPLPIDDEKDKLIFLPKPDPEQFEAKRKAERPPADHADTGPFPSKFKKAKEEFVCTMCNITATSEITFNAHLQGKKHMAKEGSGPGAGEVEKRSASTVEKGKDVDQEDPKNPGRAGTEEQALNQSAKPLEKNDFKFWCEMCQIGTQSVVVMETHKQGKKHRARLLKFGKCRDQQKEDDPNPIN